MVRPRTYRHDVRCPSCGSNWMPKYGYSCGKQVYKCGDCKRKYVPDGAYHRPPEAVKEQAIEMYCEGTSMRAIGRLMGVSATSVNRWVQSP